MEGDREQEAKKSRKRQPNRVSTRGRGRELLVVIGLHSLEKVYKARGEGWRD